MSLSNRTLWILIILWFILSIYWFYMYFFVYNLTSLKINSNIWNYKIELKNLNKKFEKNCEEKKCTLNKIPPFVYKIIISKEWYKNIEKKINLKETKNIKIILEKKIIFKENIEDKKNIEEEKKIEKRTRKQVLEKLKQRKNFYKIISLNNNKKIYVKNKENKLEFYLEDKKIFDYRKIPKDKIFVKEIFWNNWYLFFELSWKKYFVNLDTKDMIFFDLKPKINYIKNYSNLYDFDIVTDLWTYIFNIKTKKIKYFSKFFDFIYIKPKYISIVNSWDIIRKKNLWYDDKKWSLIIFYNEKTKQKIILKEVFFDIKKILKDKQKIIFISDEWKEYILDNY